MMTLFHPLLTSSLPNNDDDNDQSDDNGDSNASNRSSDKGCTVVVVATGVAAAGALC